MLGSATFNDIPKVFTKKIESYYKGILRRV